MLEEHKGSTVFQLLFKLNCFFPERLATHQVLDRFTPPPPTFAHRKSRYLQRSKSITYISIQCSELQLRRVAWRLGASGAAAQSHANPPGVDGWDTSPSGPLIAMSHVRRWRSGPAAWTTETAGEPRAEWTQVKPNDVWMTLKALQWSRALLSGPAFITSLEFGKGRPKMDKFGTPLDAGWVNTTSGTVCSPKDHHSPPFHPEWKISSSKPVRGYLLM